MKNILFIVLDSVNNDQLYNSVGSELKAPFLNYLRKKAISGDKMFSEAPYTEAALNSLLASIDTMDNEGYMKRFKNKTSVIDLMSKEGYKTYFPTFYPTIYPSYVDYGADEINYYTGYDFNQVWDYRLEYYSDLFLKGKTTSKEESFLLHLLDDNFKWWIKYLKLLKNKDYNTRMINDCLKTNKEELIKIIEKLEKEINKFNKSKIKYLKELFVLGKKHNLFKLPTITYEDKIGDDDFRNWFIENYYLTFKKIKRIQFNRNIRNCRFPLKKFIFNLNDTSISKGLLAAYKNLLFDKDIYNRINYNFDLFKSQRSFRTMANDTMEWINKNKEEKWMVYLHVDDAHYTENFFTFDTNDKNIVKSEFAKINKFLSELPKSYCGTLSSDLSILYCDDIIKEIYEYLNKNDLLKNTSIVITADHGFSYYFNPLREKYVISNYKENYNVPFLILDYDLKPKKINKFLSTKDIPATILDLAKVNIPESFKGKTLLSFEGREYANLEYMGGGCPDIKRKPVILGVRTNDYEVFMRVYIYKEFKDSILDEVYNMKKDKCEHNNLAKKRNIKKLIKNELDLIEKRYFEIKEQTND